MVLRKYNINITFNKIKNKKKSNWKINEKQIIKGNIV